MILVDDREGSAELLEPLRQLGLPAEYGAHIEADLYFEGRGFGGRPLKVGIEYKKLGECIAAIRTERLQGSQIPTMRKAGLDLCYLLLEGEWRTDDLGRLVKHVGRRLMKPYPGRMTASELSRRLHVLYFMHGVIRLTTTSRKQTLQEIEALYRTLTDKDLDQHTSHVAIYQPPPLVEISEFRGFMTRFAGLGLKTSKAVENHFGGSIRRAINATKADWLQIEGVGDKLATHIQEVLEG